MLDIFQYDLTQSLIQQLTIKHELTAHIYVDLSLQLDERVIEATIMSSVKRGRVTAEDSESSP